jgi:hypothetical protein
MGNEFLVTWLQREDLWVSNNGCSEEVKFIAMQLKKRKIYLRSDVFVIKFFIFYFFRRYYNCRNFCYPSA